MLLDRVKMAIPITTNKIDPLIEDTIAAAIADLRVVGIKSADAADADPLLRQAVITYCRCNIGNPPADEYARLKDSYDEQKAMLQGATGYGLEADDGTDY